MKKWCNDYCNRLFIKTAYEYYSGFCFVLKPQVTVYVRAINLLKLIVNQAVENHAKKIQHKNCSLNIFALPHPL